MSGKFALVVVLCLSFAVLNVNTKKSTSTSTIMPSRTKTVVPSSTTADKVKKPSNGTAVRLAQSGVVALVLLPIALHP